MCEQWTNNKIYEMNRPNSHFVSYYNFHYYLLLSAWISDRYREELKNGWKAFRTHFTHSIQLTQFNDCFIVYLHSVCLIYLIYIIHLHQCFNWIYSFGNRVLAALTLEEHKATTKKHCFHYISYFFSRIFKRIITFWTWSNRDLHITID